MFSPRIALVGALSGVATVALSTMLAMPAAATSQTCFQAQQAYATAQNTLSVATQKDQVEDSSVSGAVDSIADAWDTDKATAASAVVVARQNMDALCGTSTTPGPVGNPFPHPHPWPTPTPAPGPVGLPLLNCAQLAARGIHDIPASSAWYRTALDANGDGIGCETNLNVYRTVNNQKCHLIDGQWVPVTTVTAPAPCTACSSTVAAPPPVIYQSPPVYVAPAPTQPVYVPPAQAFTTQIAPAVPSSSAGDGSLAVDPIIPTVPGTITVTLDLNGVLHVISLPTLPVIPTL